MPELPFPDPPLRAGKIWLRPWRGADVPEIVAACSDPTVSRFMPEMPAPYTEADAVSWLESQEPARLAGRELTLAIADAGSDRARGAIGARVNEGRLSADVGYWLTPSARGHGHMTHALRALCGWLFETLELGRLELTTDPENFASQHVAQRCGFQQEGLLRAHLYFSRTGRRRDSLIWGLLPGELTRD